MKKAYTPLIVIAVLAVAIFFLGKSNAQKLN